MISPIEGITYVNQNMQVAATKQLEFQARVEFQNIIAATLANEKEQIVEELTNIEEEVAINPDREHHKEQGEETTGEKETEEKAVVNMAKKAKKSQKDNELPHILDIRV